MTTMDDGIKGTSEPVVRDDATYGRRPVQRLAVCPSGWRWEWFGPVVAWPHDLSDTPITAQEAEWLVWQRMQRIEFDALSASVPPRTDRMLWVGGDTDAELEQGLVRLQRELEATWPPPVDVLAIAVWQGSPPPPGEPSYHLEWWEAGRGPKFAVGLSRAAATDLEQELLRRPYVHDYVAREIAPAARDGAGMGVATAGAEAAAPAGQEEPGDVDDGR